MMNYIVLSASPEALKMSIDVKGMTPLVQVYDMPESVRFYCDLVGFEIVNKSPDYAPGRFHWVMLRLGDAELMLNTAYEFEAGRPPQRDPARTAAHDDTGFYFACADVDSACAELRAKGLTVTGPVSTPYGARQIGIVDPDGYLLWFQQF
jgi:catechol 2,3-dioxygenase-like lactoylglutathione lyase family enzyme